MNKIKQNKITFTLILASIAIIFSSLTILSLPVLFNYKSKVAIIEKNFYKNFKIYLNTSGKILYKPFPKPHILVENASLNLNKAQNKNSLINTTNLKIFISLRDIYLRSFNKFLTVEISNTNLYLRFKDIIEIRKHLYQKINKQIIFNNCKIFIRNNKEEVILISPVKKISYKINNKNRVKNFNVTGQIFGLNFKSEWKRNYDFPKKSFHNIILFNPKIEIENNFKFENKKKFNLNTEILYQRDNLTYVIQFENEKINIFSPNDDKTNFNIYSKINLNPFYFEGELLIKNKKVGQIIDNILLKLLFYDENILGNLNGLLKIKFDKLDNKLLKKGEIEFVLNDKKIKFIDAKFNLDKIGIIYSELSFKEDNDDLKFVSKNQLIINNHIEFAKSFQIGSNKAKKLKKINFHLERNVGEKDFIITNVTINNSKIKKTLNETFVINNIQNLRSHIRKIID